MGTAEPLLLGAVALCVGAAAWGSQERAAAPFHDRPVEAVRAAALELVLAKADVAARSGAADGRNVPGLETDLAVLGPTVQAADAASLGRAAETTLALRERDPALEAAALTHLLLSETGLAEAYEDAVDGDAEAYALGEALLTRAEGLSDALASSMLPRDRSEVEDLIGHLRDLMPGPERPERLSPDPEEAETHAEALVGVVERALDIDLYPGRDLGRAFGTVGRLSAEGCAAHAPSPLAVAAILYGEALEDPVHVLAPEDGERVEAAYALIEAGDLDAGCAALLPALDGAADMLGGAR